MEKTELRIGNLVGINKDAYRFNGLSSLKYQFKICELKADNVF